MLLQDLELDKVFFEESDSAKASFNVQKDLKYLNHGKQIRSKLLQSFAGILGITEETVYCLSRVIEIVHNATLLHDDVIDISMKRRDKPTLNYIHGNKKSVLFGDYLLAKSTHELSKLGNPKANLLLSLALKRLVDGEIFQMDVSSPFNVNLNDYFKMSKNKTGALFAWCLTSPATFIDFNQNKIDALDKIGLELGKVFQIRDDILDFTDSGKTPFIDFNNKNTNYVFSLASSELSKSQIDQLMSIDKYENLNKELQSLLNQFIIKANHNYNDELVNLLDLTDEYSKTLLEPEYLYSFQQLFKQIVDKLKI